MSDATITKITVSNGPARQSAIIAIQTIVENLGTDTVISADQVNQLRLFGCSALTGHCQNSSDANVTFHVFASTGELEVYLGEQLVEAGNTVPIIGTGYPIAHTSYRISVKRNPLDLVSLPSAGSVSFSILAYQV